MRGITAYHKEGFAIINSGSYRPDTRKRCFSSTCLTFIKTIGLFALLLIASGYQSSHSNLRKQAIEIYLEPFQQHLHASINTMISDTGNGIDHAVQIKEFYRLNKYCPAWTVNFKPNEKAEQLMELLNNSNHYGLNNEWYNYARLELLENLLMHNETEDESRIRIRQQYEVGLTRACMDFMIHLRRGYSSISTSSGYEEFVHSLPSYLHVAGDSDFSDHILSIQPKRRDYVNLQKALEEYLSKYVISDNPVSIPDPGKDSAGCKKLVVDRLNELGYIDTAITINDSVLSDAIKKFQRFHGLHEDGIIGDNTIRAMEVPTYIRYQQIALNLERIRKDTMHSDHYAYVNIPSFKLKIVRSDMVSETFNVIVGRPATPTPELTSRIDRIIANPYWNVPKSITINEILPKARKDSAYLSRNRFRLLDKNKNIIDEKLIDWQKISPSDFEYRVRQDASRSNSLGIIKFMFSNPYSVYLHDTPNKNLFTKEVRAFSHGCIRLEHPYQFARYLMTEKAGNKKGISLQYLLKNGIQHEIRLDDPFDIHLKYFTCEADDNLNIYFYNDIYDKDQAVLRELFI